MTNDLTAMCQAGQNGPELANPYLFSSDTWLAFRAGQLIAGMSTVRRCLKSRGHSVRIETAGGSKIVVKATGKRLEHIAVERS